MRNFVELFMTDLFEALARRVQLLVNLDDFFSHDLVSLLGSACKQEVVAGSHSLVTVAIHRQAEHHGLLMRLLLANIRHQRRVRSWCIGGQSKRRFPTMLLRN